MKYIIMGLFLTKLASGNMETTIKKLNPALSDQEIRAYAYAIRKYSVAYDMDPKLIAAIVATESTFKESAKGTSGEVGLMQLHPKFHANYVKDFQERVYYLFDIDNNIAIGTKYLSGLKTVFSPVYGDFRFVEHFNRGPNVKCKTFPYYKKVMSYYKMFGGSVEQQQRSRIAQDSKGKSRKDKRVTDASKTYIADIR